MKKVFLLFIVVVSIFIMFACTSSKNNDIDNSIKYTKEFPYLPSYEDEMELIEFKEGEKGEVDIATYLVKNTSPNEFLARYEELLIANGWKNSFDNKPVSINMEKDDHIAIIITPPIKDETSLKVMIYSK